MVHENGNGTDNENPPKKQRSTHVKRRRQEKYNGWQQLAI